MEDSGAIILLLLSLLEGHFPTAFKEAFITPMVKKAESRT